MIDGSKRKVRRQLVNAINAESGIAPSAFLAHSICELVALQMQYGDKGGGAANLQEAELHRQIGQSLSEFFPLTSADKAAIIAAGERFRDFAIEPGSKEAKESYPYTGYNIWLDDQEHGDREEMEEIHFTHSVQSFETVSTHHAFNLLLGEREFSGSPLASFVMVDFRFERAMKQLTLSSFWASYQDKYIELAREIVADDWVLRSPGGREFVAVPDDVPSFAEAGVLFLETLEKRYPGFDEIADEVQALLAYAPLPIVGYEAMSHFPKKTATLLSSLARAGYLARTIETELLEAARQRDVATTELLQESFDGGELGDSWWMIMFNLSSSLAGSEPALPDVTEEEALSWRIPGLGPDFLHGRLAGFWIKFLLEDDEYEQLPAFDDLRRAWKYGYFLRFLEESLPLGCSIGPPPSGGA